MVRCLELGCVVIGKGTNIYTNFQKQLTEWITWQEDKAL